MLKDLYVMKIDAKQELDNMNEEKDVQRFKKLIYVPERVNIDSLLDGDRYYLTGEKGAGKTALLIYTALKADELFDAERCFIIFKEFSQEEREDYTGLAHVTNYSQNDIVSFIDYEYVWWWLFHNTIVETVLSSSKEIFMPNEDLDLYLAAVSSISSTPRGEGRKMPRITKDGYVEISLTVPINGASINLAGKLNFEFSDSNKKNVRFSTLINEINRLYTNLSAGDSQLYLVVDEMNLSTKNTKEYDRDVIMIRDLIIAIERFNAITKNAHCNVRVIGSIRSDVINSVKAKGKEINKAIESYGIPVDWTQYEEDNLCHPLIKLLINYFRISDQNNGITPSSSDEVEYYRWVEEVIMKSPSEEILRNHTLYRPRHVIRLLNISKMLCGDATKISDSTFNKIRRYYSRECWNEVTEELSLMYTPLQLEFIKEWLTGSPWRATYNEMYEKAEAMWKGKIEADMLLNGFSDLMRALYKSGVIGNWLQGKKTPIHRWYFRGDETLLTSQMIQINRIFGSVLSTQKPTRSFDFY